MAKPAKQPSRPKPAPAPPPPSTAPTNGAAAFTPRLSGPLLPSLGRAATAGFALLLLALVLAPLVGGYPSGAAYGADGWLNVLRALVIGAGLVAWWPALTPVPSPNCSGFAGGRGGPATKFSLASRQAAAELVTGTPLPPAKPEQLGEGTGVRAADTGVRAALWLAFALTLLSLLVHSRFLTRPVLLFALLPATLDWLCYALAFTLAARFGRVPKAPALLAGVLAGAGVLVALSVARDYGQNAQVFGRAWRAQGVFFDPNFAAGFLALCLPLGAAACLVARQRIAALLWSVGTALLAGALVATGSRAGVGAAVLGLGVAFALALLGRVRLPWARVGALLAAVALLAFAFRGPLTQRLGGNTTTTNPAQTATSSSGGGQEHSGNFRAWTWRGTAAMANAHPWLGAGPGTFEFVYPRWARVAKTNLAHSSYSQLAAEQGWPALAATGLALLLALAAGLRGALGRGGEQGETDAGPDRLLLCALVGGLVAGMVRSYFDSEWSLLGNGLPFWAVAGLVAAGLPTPVAGRPPAPRSALRITAAAGLVAALGVTLLLLTNALRLASLSTRPDPEAARQAAQSWPPDPNALAAYGRSNPDQAVQPFERAALIEPTGARFFRLARVYEQQGRPGDAVRAFEKASAADPTNLQTWRALAEARARTGDAAGALAAWRRLAQLQEGPVGRIRAIPEQTETHPAFAYAALADAALQNSDRATAAGNYEKAARIVEAYSQTAPVYQVLELAAARQQRVNLAGRRQELKQLYERVMAQRERVTPLGPEREALAVRRAATLARLDKMIAEAGAD